MRATEILAEIKAKKAEVVTVATARVGGSVPVELVEKFESFCKTSKVKRNTALQSALEDFLDGYEVPEAGVENVSLPPKKGRKAR